MPTDDRKNLPAGDAERFWLGSWLRDMSREVLRFSNCCDGLGVFCWGACCGAFWCTACWKLCWYWRCGTDTLVCCPCATCCGNCCWLGDLWEIWCCIWGCICCWYCAFWKLCCWKLWRWGCCWNCSFWIFWGLKLWRWGCSEFLMAQIIQTANPRCSRSSCPDHHLHHKPRKWLPPTWTTPSIVWEQKHVICCYPPSNKFQYNIQQTLQDIIKSTLQLHTLHKQKSDEWHYPQCCSQLQCAQNLSIKTLIN